MKSSYHSISKLLLTALFGFIFALSWTWQNATPIYAQGPPLDISMAFAGGATELHTDAGVEFTYFLSYRCASANSHCYNTVITDTLPAPLQLTDYSTTPHIASVTTTGNTIVFHFVDPLPAGSTGLLEIQAMFPPGTLPGTTSVNTATSSTTGGTSVTNPTTAIVNPATFNMDLSKTSNSDVDNFVVGAEFDTTYLLQFNTNPGINLINPVVTDTLPAGAIYRGSSPAG
ncbi:MAG TPA: hypothetical protein ENK24_02250, partial [Anaerolineae bacterium]|nr:hypothetical protein [Anaerolineae bacterium]